ncbi:MAG: trans-sulfuration enzyme family protein [Thermoplasmatota archaeon]
MPEPQWRSTVTPIHQTATFDFATVEAMDAWYEGRVEGFHYTRYGNPTTAEVEKKIALLEAADAAVVTGSGMAAIVTTLLSLLRTGDRVVSVRDVYGGTYGAMTKLLDRMGVHVDWVPVDDVDALERALSTPAKVVYLETPTNPLLKICDLETSARLARQAGAVSVVDSTFATPIHTQPRTLGVDIVIHSATKALGGHSDISAGAVAGPKKLMDGVLAMHKMVGAVLDPHASFLLDRGLKTLDLRVRQQATNARAIARLLEKASKVRGVHYPGLESHPQHKLAARQMHNGFGSVLSFDLPTKEAAFRFTNALRHVHNAASLGGVESLVSLPVITSHRSLPAAELAAVGIQPGTVRLAMGVEPIETLEADIVQALAKA